MARHRVSHHLGALRDVVDATTSVAPDVAVPWDALLHLGSLVRADLVVLEGVDHLHRRSYFSQVLARELRVFTTRPDPVAAEGFWQLVRRAAAREQVTGAAVARGPDPPGSSATARPGGAVHRHLVHALSGRRGRPSVLLGSIPDGYAREVRLLCLRHDGADFGERDELDVALLLPHLERAYRRGDRDRAARCVTARQALLLELVRDGYTNAQIATRLQVAEGTVRSHLNNIYVRMGVRSRTEAVSRLFGGHGLDADPVRPAGAEVAGS